HAPKIRRWRPSRRWRHHGIGNRAMEDSPRSHGATATAKDPVCAMDVVPGRAGGGSAEHAGTTYWFCNPGCREKFLADPPRYLSPGSPRGTAAPALTPPPGTDTTSATSGRAAPGSGLCPHTCPMHPEVRTAGPGSCPRCGMALERVDIAPIAVRTEWVCPMHPEIVRSGPGSCPICGMALEPRTPTGVEEANPELADMTRRFWIGLVLTVPLMAVAMSDLWPGQPLQQAVAPRLLGLLQLLLATPVVLWAGWPFFE